MCGRQYLDNSPKEDRSLTTGPPTVRSLTFGSRMGKGIGLLAKVNNIFNDLYEPKAYYFQLFLCRLKSNNGRDLVRKFYITRCSQRYGRCFP